LTSQPANHREPDQCEEGTSDGEPSNTSSPPVGRIARIARLSEVNRNGQCCGTSRGKRKSKRPVRTSHSFGVPSVPVVSSRSPSGEKAAVLSSPTWATQSGTGSPV